MAWPVSQGRNGLRARYIFVRVLRSNWPIVCPTIFITLFINASWANSYSSSSY